MTAIIGAALAELIADAREINLPLDIVGTVMEIVTVEQVNNPLNDADGEAFDYAYLDWCEKQEEIAQWHDITDMLALEGWESWEEAYTMRRGNPYPLL